MQNKYLYSFLKDRSFQIMCILPVVAIIIWVILLRLNIQQNGQLKSLNDKQKLILQIPAMQSKIAELKSAVNGLILSGIVAAKTPMAVINNTLLKVGDEIGGRKIVSIGDHVVKVCDVGSTNKCIELSLEQ
jgi:hypothetical protein